MQTIIAHPNFEYLADEIVKLNPNTKKAKVKFETFKDSWPNIFIENIDDDIEHQVITYIWDYSRPEYLFTNYSIVRWLLGYHADKLRVIVPFFPVWTMERISKKWEVATSKYFADILSHIPSWRNQKTSIHIYDIHTLEQRFFFDDFKVNAELHTATNIIKQNISPETIIVFPDAWAKKRFGKDFEWFEIITCSKVRVWDSREITIDEWNPKNKDLIIIDDLIQSWGTIIETAKVLKNLWAKTVSGFATHWVFVEKSYLKLCQNLDTLYTTDSIPKNMENAKEISNLKVLSLASDINKKIINNY